MQNYLDTVLSQYATAPKMMALIESMNDCLDPAANIDNFYSWVWDLDTAKGYGLDVWGRIVGVGRILTVPATSTNFGFEEASGDPFGVESFYSGPVTSNYSLPDAAFRTLIFVKALANISRSCIETYNRMLMQLFPGRGNAYVVDNLDMTAQLAFTFPLEPYETSIINQSGAFAPPTGVLFSILDLSSHGLHSAIPGYAIPGYAIPDTTP